MLGLGDVVILGRLDLLYTNIFFCNVDNPLCQFWCLDLVVLLSLIDCIFYIYIFNVDNFVCNL